MPGFRPKSCRESVQALPRVDGVHQAVLPLDVGGMGMTLWWRDILSRTSENADAWPVRICFLPLRPIYMVVWQMVDFLGESCRSISLGQKQ